MVKLGKGLTLLFLVFLVIGTMTSPAQALWGSKTPAQRSRDAQQLVERARMTFEDFSTDPQMGNALRSLVRRAKAVLIYPQVLKGAVVFGGSGGTGVLLARDSATNRWSDPAFYTLGELSFGLQAGGQSSQVVLVALTDRGLNALLSHSAKLGADASVAIGPVGAGAEAATQNLSADIISYSRAKGLFAGISVEGAVVAVRDSLNDAYYGRHVTPTDILVRHDVRNPQAAGLVNTLSRVA